jgi:homoserine trans-succinylase
VLAAFHVLQLSAEGNYYKHFKFNNMKNYKVIYLNTEYSVMSISVTASNEEEARLYVYGHVENCIKTLSAEYIN